MMKNKSKMMFLGMIALMFATSMFLTGCAEQDDDVIKIGVITDLSGPAAYWGESSRVGAELAKQDLLVEGYDIKLIFEDYQLEADKALTAAQKLVNFDRVDSVYAEFNPAAIAVGSFLENKNILYVYDAAVVSPLEKNSFAFKTYLDYEEGCRQIAHEFKNEGVETIGVLKVNLEFGETCLKGVRDVYTSNVFVENYNLGDQDFRTHLLKLGNAGVNAVINVGFEGDTLNTLKVIKEQNLNIKYGSVEDTITPKVLSDYSDILEGSITFGFPEVSSEFLNRISSYELSTPYGAAITYTHIMQIGRVLGSCDDDLDCIKRKMNESPADTTIGFIGFNNNVAEFDMTITKR